MPIRHSPRRHSPMGRSPIWTLTHTDAHPYGCSHRRTFTHTDIHPYRRSPIQTLTHMEIYPYGYSACIDECFIGGVCDSVCDKFDFQPRIRTQIYLGQHFLPNTIKNIFRLNIFEEHKYEYIWDDIFWRTQIRLYFMDIKAIQI